VRSWLRPRFGPDLLAQVGLRRDALADIVETGPINRSGTSRRSPGGRPAKAAIVHQTARLSARREALDRAIA
jgi:hypothetical protein